MGTGSAPLIVRALADSLSRLTTEMKKQMRKTRRGSRAACYLRLVFLLEAFVHLLCVLRAHELSCLVVLYLEWLSGVCVSGWRSAEETDGATVWLLCRTWHLME